MLSTKDQKWCYLLKIIGKYSEDRPCAICRRSFFFSSNIIIKLQLTNRTLHSCSLYIGWTTNSLKAIIIGSSFFFGIFCKDSSSKCNTVFDVAFKARMRTSLTPSKWGHLARTKFASLLCSILQWYVLLRSINHILALFCMCLLYTFVLTLNMFVFSLAQSVRSRTMNLFNWLYWSSTFESDRSCKKVCENYIFYEGANCSS